MVGLNLNPLAGLFSDTLQVIVKPLEHVLHPVKPNHFWERFAATTAQVGPVVQLNRTVGVVVIPLTKQTSGFYSSIDQTVDGWYRHVGVNVPIVHALDEVNAAFVILKNPVEEVALSPVVPGDLGTKHVGADAGSRADDVIRAHVLIVLFVAVNTVRPVDTVVHDGCPRFRRTVFPHEFFHANKTRNRDDGLQVIMLGPKHGRLPRCAAVVGFADQRYGAIGPWLFCQPSHSSIVPELFGVAHQIHAVIAPSGTRD